MESPNMSKRTASSSEIFEEKPQDKSTCLPVAPVLITRYHSIMDDEGADDVFIHPPPSSQTSLTPCLPAEGTAGAIANNSGVTLSYGAADATKAKANPSGLGRHHSEKQLMEARNELDEVIPSTEQSSNESMDNVLVISDKDSTSPTYQDQASVDSSPCLMETCRDEAGEYTLDNSSGHGESDEEPEVIVLLSEGEENGGETDAKREKQPPQTTSNIKENSENETCLAKEGDQKTYKDGCFDERDFSLSRGNLESKHVESDSSTQPDISANRYDFESSEAAKIYECNQNMMGEANSEPQVANFSVDMTNDNEGHVDNRSLDYSHATSDWVRKKSSPIEIEISQLPLSKGFEEMVEQTDGSKRIATDIQQGEELLQRLQMVQLRHDEILDIPGEGEAGLGTKVEDGRLSGFMAGEEEKDESRFHSPKKEEIVTSLTENVQNERIEGEHVTPKVRTSSSSMSGQPEHEQIIRKEADDSEDEQSDCLLHSDLLPIGTHEKSCAEIPTIHRFSAAETSMEKQIHEAAQGRQNLQRAEGFFNLADNPDVLEIPFKTNFSLESLLTKACTSQHGHWQFSEKKMQKEISQDIQRELVLVNQGRIPGGYSKGEVRQLKETKLLFEAFHQDNTEGPTRHRKPRTSVMKGDVYPSVLERTRSLEMFSQKSYPVSRAHSLRLSNSGATCTRDKSPENLRSRSPTGGYQDKTRLTPYSKQDKHLRLHRSLDSICNEASTSSVETKGKTREGKARQGSPILKHNPFFKLRPALALQPEVEKDIREAREREEELRKQRCSLYGESRQQSEDEEKSQCSETFISDVGQKSRGKLERVWPPPSKRDQKKSEHTQEPKVHRVGGQKASLWERWESGLINGQTSNEKK